ncbi:GNAT family N-acetyltransferase [Demetria terragena]|uniref:GNAT family N-acetyltransferase n=1 Tax=Demetria terragena TaxID=63959 RepID=UPI00037D99E1|nr:GNAT family N-acetyltransferase [Demetria terragena]
MTIQIRGADDAEKFLQTDLTVWADGRLPLPLDTAVLPQEEQRFAAVLDDWPATEECYAGIYGVYDLELSIPGAQDEILVAPVAGLTWVGVHPDARRRGVLSAMMRDHFERTAAANSSGLSVLNASEPAIYGRFGYGVAAAKTVASLSTGTTLEATGLEEDAARISTRLVTARADGVPERMRAAAHAAAMHAHGSVVRELRTYERFVAEPHEVLYEKEPWQCFLATENGADIGYAFFRREPKWDNDQPQGVVTVELVGTPPAQLALMRRLLSLDLMSTVKISPRPTDDVLRAWLGSERGVIGPSVDNLWLRFVDLPKAMSLRGYTGPGEVVIEVADEVLPDQGGRWLLTATAHGQGGVERTDRAADLSLTTQQLASAYLGAGGLPTLHRGGLLTEQRDGAVVELEHMMRTAAGPAGSVGF